MDIPYRKIVGVDPGKTTGFAAFDNLGEGGEYSCVMHTEIQSPVGIPSSVVVGKTVGEYIIRMSKNNPQHKILVVCESWEFRHNEASVDANYACGPIGVLQYITAQLGNVDIILQKPGFRSQITDEALKTSGYWLKGGHGHMRQAAKHVLAYLLSKKHRPTQERLYPR